MPDILLPQQDAAEIKRQQQASAQYVILRAQTAGTVMASLVKSIDHDDDYLRRAADTSLRAADALLTAMFTDAPAKPTGA